MDELGESMSSSKYDNLIKSLADLDVALVDANNEYRSTYDILSDIADKWDSLSTMEQSALADTIAGTRQQAVFFSIIEQFQEASGAMDAMASSAGTLENAYAAYLDSTTAHINQFKASFEELSANTFNSKLIANVVDLGTAFTGFINALVKTKTILVAIPLGVFVSKLIKMGQAAAASRVSTIALANSILQEKGLNDQLTTSVAALDAEQRKLLATELQLSVKRGVANAEERAHIMTEVNNIAVNEALEAENYSLATSFQAVTAAIPGWAWVAISIVAVVSVMGALIKKSEEMRQAFKDNTDEINDQVDALKDYKQRLKDISESDESSTKKLEDYNKIRQEIIDGYDVEIGKINDEADALDTLNGKLDEEIERKRKLYLNDNEDEFKKTVEQSKDFVQNLSIIDAFSKFWKNELVGNWKELHVQQIFGDKSISKNILDIFDYGTAENLTSGTTFGIGTNAKDELELLKTLENAYIRFGEIKEAREVAGNELTEGEMALYKALQKQYNLLKENLGEEGFNFDTALEYAANKVDQLVAEIPQGNMSLDAWRNKLIEAANGEQLFIDKINEMINALKAAADDSDVDPFKALSESLDLIEGKLERVNEAIKTANEYFEDLTKVIDKNNESDKFFTADEMIDMLDKYPELADNILVTAYGYKFETEALEELRKAKLEEQKTAISAQIAEAMGAKESAESELSSISAKLNGIETLAEAEVALAEVEEQINKSGGNEISAELAEKRKNLQAAVDAWKRISAANQSIEKATMQYTLLGNVFDNVKDKSNDTSKALNNQKEKLKDLSDEYKKAKDNIEDLIKLTMEMIMPKGKVRYYWKRWCAHSLE